MGKMDGGLQDAVASKACLFEMKEEKEKREEKRIQDIRESVTIDVAPLSPSFFFRGCGCLP